MAQFYDDFNRANGAPGGNWNALTGSATIAGGFLTTAFNGVLDNTSVSDVNRNEASAVFGNNGTASVTQAVGVKVGSAGTAGYWAYFTYSAPNYTLTLARGALGALVVLASQAIGAYLPFSYELRIVYDAGVVTATYQGTTTLTANDLTYSAGSYCGLILPGTAARVDTFLAIGGAAATLAVSPTVIGNYGTATSLTFTGTGTSWTPGTPGSPTITCDHGTLSAQAVASATSATATYDPGTYLGLVTFTDPSTGATATATVTSNVGVLPPNAGGCGFNQDFIDEANNTPDLTSPQLLSDQTIVWPAHDSLPDIRTLDALKDILTAVQTYYMPAPFDTGLGEAVANIWNMLGGGWHPSPIAFEPSTGTPIKSDTEYIAGRIDALTEGGTLSLASLGGSPTLYSHKDLLDAINALSTGGGSSQDVLDAISGMRGPSQYDLDTVVGHLKDIRTPDLLTLGDVKGWIDALPRDWSTHLDTLAITGSIAALALEIAGLYALEGEDAVSSSAAAAAAVEAAAITTLDLPLIIDMLGKIKELLAPRPTARAAPPIWPGEANVTWGASIPIESNEPVVGRMHGVAVQIDGCQPGTRFFGYDGITNYSHVGALAFGTDRGDLEAFQAFGSVKGVYVPRYMSEAFTCRLYRSRNVRGTIQPWTITGA